ncbi:MAG TPA: asparagine synthase (glutamine-hydrolyzing), partial [Nitrospiraceae bacterium]
MCGIAGIYSVVGKPVEPFDIVRMCEAQAHRGPDDAGYVLLSPLAKGQKPSWWEITRSDQCREFPDPQTQELHSSKPSSSRLPYRLGLGHRRLSILDLSTAGHQPMANREKTLWITYNGEIYNHLELKKDLIRKGYEFVSTTDTEVILYLYQEYGADCIDRLNGMFAFALWDELRGSLMLARDRYGVKPLYYTEWQGSLLFASEVKAFLALRDFPRQVNQAALRDYFTFQNTFGEATLFDGVHLLDPGHSLIVTKNGITRRRYWDFNFSQIEDLGENQARERLGFLLEDTIKRQLMSDVPVGAYLSGGMDSASITALASASVPRLMTFTGGFDLTNVSGFEAAFDERHDAEMLSALFKTEHYEMVFHAGDLEWALPRVIWSIEDLRAGMCYPYYFTARLASRFVKVVLAGTGGDEIFAGYPWRYRMATDETANHDD